MTAINVVFIIEIHSTSFISLFAKWRINRTVSKNLKNQLVLKAYYTDISTCILRTMPHVDFVSIMRTCMHVAVLFIRILYMDPPLRQKR